MYGWHLETSQGGRNTGGEPSYKVVRLLAPGVEPKKLFVDIGPPPKTLWAVCVQEKSVTQLLQRLGKPVDGVVVLPGPVPRVTKWVIVRDVDEATFRTTEEAMGDEEGTAFCTYAAFKGSFTGAAVVAQAFWRRSVKCVGTMLVLWQTVNHQLRRAKGSLKGEVQIQWVASNKLRIAFMEAQDAVVFQQTILAELRLRGMVFKDERTGEYWDAEDVSSVGGSSAAGSTTSSSGGGDECVVVTDLPDYFLQKDVEEVVVKALGKLQGVAEVAVEVGLRARRMEWCMGSPMSPTWQVRGPHVSRLEGTMLTLNDQGAQQVAMVHTWRDYASARAAFRDRAQRGRAMPGPGQTTAQWLGQGQGQGQFSGGDVRMEVRVTGDKRPRDV